MAKHQNAATKGSGLRGFYLLLGGVALAGLAFLGYSVMGRGGRAATEPVEVAGIEDMRSLVARAEGVAIGESSAPVKLIVFSDYQCPYCGQFALRVKPLLEQNEIKAGKLQVVFYDFPLGGGHKHSFTAARAARCAGDQGKFWEYHDLLFSRMTRWSPKATTPLEEFEEFAGEVGLDRDAFGQCLNSDRYADVVTANRMLGDELGVNATPTVIINNKRVANPLDYQALSELIAQETGA